MHWFWKKRLPLWWEETIRLLQTDTVSMKEKKQVVDLITSQTNLLSEKEWKPVLAKLIEVLKTLSHQLFIDYCWERGEQKLDVWKNGDAKALHDSCVLVKNELIVLRSEMWMLDIECEEPNHSRVF